MHPYVHSSIYNNQSIGATQVLINWMSETNQWINKMWLYTHIYPHTLDYYSATKRSEMLPCAANGWPRRHYAKKRKLEKDKYSMFSPTCGILEKPNEKPNKTKTEL